MNKNIELFNAIKTKDRGLVSEIVNKYKSEINVSAVDDNKSFAHYAAKKGIITIIEDVVITLRCDLTIKDSENKLAIDTDYDWSGRLKAAIVTRQEYEAAELRIRQFKEYEQRVHQEEERRGAYLRGTIFTHNFSLIYGSKKPFKTCVIDDAKDDISNLSIHEQQAIVEALTFCRRHNQSVNDFINPFPLKSTNFLIINIGFVISEGNYIPGGNEHSRKFISFPFFIDKDHNFNNELHSEDFFLQFLQSKFKAILEGVTNKIVSNGQRKIYSIVFDLHSSQDMCDNCEKAVANFEINNINHIKTLLSDSGFIVPKDDNNNFKVLFRVSATRPPSHSAYRKEPHLRNSDELMVRIYTHEGQMDLKKSELPLILHSDKLMQSSLATWYNKDAYQGATFFHIPKYSIFENQIGYTNPELPETIPVSRKTV